MGEEEGALLSDGDEPVPDLVCVNPITKELKVITTDNEYESSSSESESDSDSESDVEADSELDSLSELGYEIEDILPTPKDDEKTSSHAAAAAATSRSAPSAPCAPFPPPQVRRRQADDRQADRQTT